MTSHPALPKIIREFEQHKDALRLKKLLIYTLDNHWESNSRRLQQLNLAPILDEVPQQFPSLVYLQEALQVSVNTLSRPDAYSQFADFIVKAIAPLYEKPTSQDDSEGATRIVAAAPPKSAKDTGSTSSRVIIAVAREMESHPEGIRIKKLLFALCHERWENDFQILGQASYLQLIRQVKDLHPVPTELADALQSLVSSLNRQSLYAILANFILETISPLYHGPVDAPTGLTKPTFPPIKMARPETGEPDQKYQGFMFLGSKDSEPSPPPADIDISMADLDLPGNIPSASLSDITDPRLQVTASLYEQPNGISEEESGATASALNLPAGTDVPAQPEHFADGLNIFELKLEIMKYANPLRAKILLFSAAHHTFDLSGQDWSLLRTCDFDDLLRTTIQASPSVVALEIRLAAIAQSLFEPKEHLQATSALIQAIKLLSQST
ncbi:hypothetical protein Lepto7376_1647 [[Leptolyngbya] sp. PCC 7376]|uniref:hypothetical protein n=1 Tax=[Leptolyngbya] sp. PCC 7376 TaxID=111781 RepID=UPI00029F1CE0|nr:hypothetical protein [[Leptolyngbya] sp. PCC 7376]AFY37981.1 hypothetical protein Lepto7376_1647 [[Leptolyngbya] sp. PCC 7376]